MREEQTVRRTDFPAGEYRIEVMDLTVDCDVVGPTARPVTVPADGIAVATIEVSCSFVPRERIVYNSFQRDQHTSEIFSVRPDGSDLKTLRGRGPEQSYPDWSPDGTRILYQGNDVADRVLLVWIMNHDGSEATPIARGSSTSAVIEGSRPDWSPDGTKVAFESRSDIFVADLERRGLQNIVNLTGDGQATDDGGPAWSPDGARIAFHRDLVVHVMDADGGDLVALRAGAFPVWTPDASRILFVDRGLGQIASMRPDGSDVRVLTNQEGGAGHPEPSRDGERIAFHSPSFSEDSRIWIINADGSNPRIIESVPAHAEHPNWGP